MGSCAWAVGGKALCGVLWQPPLLEHAEWELMGIGVPQHAPLTDEQTGQGGYVGHSRVVYVRASVCAHVCAQVSPLDQNHPRLPGHPPVLEQTEPD